MFINKTMLCRICIYKRLFDEIFCFLTFSYEKKIISQNILEKHSLYSRIKSMKSVQKYSAINFSALEKFNL